MPYGFYLRKNRRKFRKVAVQPKTPVVATYKYPKKYSKSAKKTTFAKRVNQIISRNVENKKTATLTLSNPVAIITGSPAQYFFYTWAPGADVVGSRLFNINGGSEQAARIGNTVKLKRWIIKGIIEPVAPVADQMVGGMTGYVDIYFGKYKENVQPVQNTLVGLYQNGNTVSSPSCKSTDQLQALNTDNYKVYYHRRFKMGASFDQQTAPTAGFQAPANNDFKLSQTFGFDVCKYILKDRKLKWPDATGQPPFFPPNDIDITNLTLWATWSPWTGQSTLQVGTSKTLYFINALTYAEYEDA